MTRKLRTSLLVFLVTFAAIGGVVILLVGWLAPPEGITVTTQGSAVVGSDFRFLVTVRMTGPQPSTGLYLSLGGLTGTFDVTPRFPGDRPNVWNLTGMDLTSGRTFVLDTTPIWAAEMILRATVWSPSHGIGAVRFINGDMIDTMTATPGYGTPVPLTTTWPLLASASPDAPLVRGQAANLRVAVRGTISGPRTPSLLYLQVVTKPVYYTLAGADPNANPLHLTTLWNITGADLSRGVDVNLTATPMMSGDRIPFDVLVWSPRGSLADVHVDNDGTILTQGAIRLWVDTTFSLSVATG